LLKCPTDGCGRCITKYQVVSRYGKKQRVDRQVNLETGEEQDTPVVQVPQKKEKKRHAFKSGASDDNDDSELSALLAESERLMKEKEERQKQQALERQQQQDEDQKQREREREQKRKQKVQRANLLAGGSIVAQRAVPVRTEPRQVEIATAPTEDDVILAMKAMETSGRWVIRDDGESEDEEEPAQLFRQQKKTILKREKSKKLRTITVAGGGR
jgi:hypothetical protein